MPVTSSEIIEDSKQADGRRWITEKHFTSTGQDRLITYLAEAKADAKSIMLKRVSNIDQQLIDQEISQYINKIEKGENVIGLKYTETTQKERASKFLEWAKEKIDEEDFNALRYAHRVIDPYSEKQINGLLAETDYENKADKVKTWVQKIKDMKLAMDESVIAAEEV